MLPSFLGVLMSPHRAGNIIFLLLQTLLVISVGSEKQRWKAGVQRGRP